MQRFACGVVAEHFDQPSRQLQQLIDPPEDARRIHQARGFVRIERTQPGVVHRQGSARRRFQTRGEQEARDVVELRAKPGRPEIDQPCPPSPEEHVLRRRVAVHEPERPREHLQPGGGEWRAGRIALLGREAKAVERQVALRDQFVRALLPAQPLAQRQRVELREGLHRSFDSPRRRHEGERGHAFDPLLHRNLPEHRKQGRCEGKSQPPKRLHHREVVERLLGVRGATQQDDPRSAVWHSDGDAFARPLRIVQRFKIDARRRGQAQRC